nr:Tn3 family transposase [Brevibacillus daliensis]
MYQWFQPVRLFQGVGQKHPISIWNTVYLSQAIEHFKDMGKYQEELLPHISPLGWELGEYSFKTEASNSIHSLRPLRK